MSEFRNDWYNYYTSQSFHCNRPLPKKKKKKIKSSTQNVIQYIYIVTSVDNFCFAIFQKTRKKFVV